MDAIAECFYQLRFRIALLEKKGTAFETWFVALAGHAFGSDFVGVRSYGNRGDWKCDGLQVSTGTIFQCYAPDSLTDTKTIDKITEDFTGALEKWSDQMKVWVFVHNDLRGLSPTIVSHINSLQKQNPEVKIETWSEPNLFELFNLLTSKSKERLFGPVPNQRVMDRLALSDLEPVIDALEQRDPDPSDEFPPPPSVRKLEKNALSEDSANLLQFGRRKVGLVDQYFRKSERVELGEKIAEEFRKRYSDLKSLELPPDQIFMYLQQYAGMSGEPRRQAAVMAVLAYFFDTCDIFEDPEFEVHI